MTSEQNQLQRRALRDFIAIRRNPEFRNAVDGFGEKAALDAALFFAQTLGYCRLWGVILGDLDGSIPASILPMICESMTNRVNSVNLSLESYEQDMEFSRTVEETELFSCTILRQRMDAWAMWIAIDERIQMLVGESEVSGAVSRSSLDIAVERLLDSVEQWDYDLKARADLLVTAVDTFLLENWRSALSESYSRVIPWWLDDVFWGSVRAEPIPNYLPLRLDQTLPSQRSQSDGATQPRESAVESKFVAQNRIEFKKALVLGATADDAAFHEVRFQSRTDRSGAVAIVQIPLRFNTNGTMVVRVQFLYASREPSKVRVGTSVSLGLKAGSVITVQYPDDGQSIYSADVCISQQLVEVLSLQLYQRLRVGDHHWYSETALFASVRR